MSTVCGSGLTRVIDSRPTPYGVRRRRECESCEGRFTTYELTPPRRTVEREKAAA